MNTSCTRSSSSDLGDNDNQIDSHSRSARVHQDIKDYKKALLTMRDDLQTRYAAIGEDIGGGLSEDSGERVVELENAELLNALTDETLVQLKGVNLALARIETGTFGLCVQCGVEIQRKRLDTFPQASRCITCASQREEK